MQPRRFPIGFWNSEKSWNGFETKVEEWIDLGFTMVMTPPFDPAIPEERAAVGRLLELAREHDFQLILKDRRAEAPSSPWGNSAESRPLPKSYAKGARAAVSEYEGHPSVWGLYVVDEPLVGNLPAVAEACKAIRKAGKRLHPYVNLLPNHAVWGGEHIGGQVGFQDFNEYLDHYLETTGDEMLCFDCYCQASEEWGGRDRYFLNLAQYQAAALRHNVPFWLITLAAGHWMYKAPTELELLWEFNTALAYGAQGLLYFIYRVRPGGGDTFYGAPVDELGQRGPLYQQMKRQHRCFQRCWEERFRKLRPTLTTHYPQAPAGVKPFKGEGVAKRILFAAGVSELIIGEFADDQGRPHVMVVNNSAERHVAVTVSCAGRAAFRLGEQGELLERESTAGTVDIGGILLPAAALLYRIEP